MNKPEITPDQCPRDHAEFCSPAPCGNCKGFGVVDIGGVTPWGSHIDMPCPSCKEKWDELAVIGASWRQDSSLEKWFPLTAEELAKIKALNYDKFTTIQAYCRAASFDKWRIKRLVEAIDQYLSFDGYRDASKILTEALADAVNAGVVDKEIKCETCQNLATVHIESVGLHFCESCVQKIDARFAELVPAPK